MYNRLIEDGGAAGKELGPAIAAAPGRGAGEGELAFASLAAALATGDAAAAQALMARLDADPGRASDAYYQLAAGAALDRAGDPKALERYDAALRAEPRLVAAELRLVRAALLAGAADGAARARAPPPKKKPPPPPHPPKQKTKAGK